MTEPYNRLMKARVMAGYRSARAAARALDTKPATYAAHENGSRGFDIDSTLRYAKLFDVSPGWILTGENFHGESPAKILEDDAHLEDDGHGTPLSEQDILDFGKQVIKLLPQHTPELSPGYTSVGQFAVHRMVDEDTDFDEGEQWGYVAQWQFPSNYITETLKVAPDDIAILAVVDDNMSPTYKIGDHLIIDVQQKEFREDGVYFFLTEIEYIHIQNVTNTGIQFALSNDNPAKSAKHPERTIDKEAVDIQGRICGVIATR